MKKGRRQGQAATAVLSEARRRAILMARAERLSRRAPTAEATPRDRLLVCAVGPNLYGLPLGQVSKVQPFDRRGAAPSRQAAALGLIVDGGEIRPVLDLGVLLGRSEARDLGGWLVILAAPYSVALRVQDLPATVLVEALGGEETDRARIAEGEHASKILTRLSAPDLLAAYSNSHHGAPAP